MTLTIGNPQLCQLAGGAAHMVLPSHAHWSAGTFHSTDIMERWLMVLLVMFPLSLSQQWVFPSEKPPCPEQLNGAPVQCVRLNQCPYALRMLFNFRRGSNYMPTRCGWHGMIPKVCCTFTPKTTSSPEQKSKITTTKPKLTEEFEEDLIFKNEAGCGLFDTTPYLHENVLRRVRRQGKTVARTQKPSTKHITSYVVGGHQSNPDTWPWIAAILKGREHHELTFMCGGFLITRRYVMTAAHCFQEYRLKRQTTYHFSVRIGQLRYDRGIVTQVEEVIVHESFQKNQFYYDIALLRLTESITNVPTCLPDAGLTAKSIFRDHTTVLGWGDTKFGGPSVDTLHEVNNVPVTSVKECNDSYSRLQGSPFKRGITEEFICAGLKQGGKDACQGDSGGPLMLKRGNRWTTIGIVSFGYRCGEPGFPGVYTNIAHYLPWIQQHINKRRANG